MKILFIGVGEEPEVREIEKIDGDYLESAQKLVGGNIQEYHFHGDYVVICNEDTYDGAGSPLNRAGIYGDMFITKVDNEDWTYTSLDEKDLKRLKHIVDTFLPAPSTSDLEKMLCKDCKRFITKKPYAEFVDIRGLCDECDDKVFSWLTEESEVV
jgi:hypothetical protein